MQLFIIEVLIFEYYLIASIYNFFLECGNLYGGYILSIPEGMNNITLCFVGKNKILYAIYK